MPGGQVIVSGQTTWPVCAYGYRDSVTGTHCYLMDIVREGLPLQRLRQSDLVHKTVGFSGRLSTRITRR